MSSSNRTDDAGDCKPQFQIFNEIMMNWAEQAGKLLGSKADTVASLAADQFDKLVDKVNEIAGNTWARVGPRIIEEGRAQTGTLVAPGDRAFLSAHPLAKDEATIAVTKKDGKCGATVTICKIDQKGRYTKLKQFRFNTGKADVPKTETHTVSGLRDHILQVYLDGQGGIGTKLAYDFKVTLHGAADASGSDGAAAGTAETPDSTRQPSGVGVRGITRAVKLAKQ